MAIQDYPCSRDCTSIAQLRSPIDKAIVCRRHYQQDWFALNPEKAQAKLEREREQRRIRAKERRQQERESLEQKRREAEAREDRKNMPLRQINAERARAAGQWGSW